MLFSLEEFLNSFNNITVKHRRQSWSIQIWKLLSDKTSSSLFFAMFWFIHHLFIKYREYFRYQPSQPIFSSPSMSPAMRKALVSAAVSAQAPLVKFGRNNLENESQYNKWTCRDYLVQINRSYLFITVNISSVIFPNFKFFQIFSITISCICVIVR